MRRCSPALLETETEDWLARRQAEIDAKPTHAAQYEAGRGLFAQKRSAAFNDIRRKLAAATPAGKCCYCETDRYRDIDHIRPLRHYPGQAFRWPNYVFACTPCNQDAKRDGWALIDSDGVLIEDWPDGPPPAGTEAMIDIRSEEPSDYIDLDLETGVFLPRHSDDIAHTRATYTLRLLRLNDDPRLPKARRQAAQSFARLLDDLKNSSALGDTARAARIRQEIAEAPHPSVLTALRKLQTKEPL